VKKEGWPEFPLNWETMRKWNMSSLRRIASHLEEKTAQRRLNSSSGFRGESTDMEKQIFQHIIDLQQQVFVLEDVFQAFLQIIDDNRPSQRIKRLLRWIAERSSRYGERIWSNPIFKIVGALSTIAFAIAALIYLFHLLRQ
jgi:hypothetical protein